jgi:hypothetical protein
MFIFWNSAAHFQFPSSPKEAKPGCIRKTRGSGQINSESLVQPGLFIENKGLATYAGLATRLHLSRPVSMDSPVLLRPESEKGTA